MSDYFHNPEEALAYMTEVSLATLEVLQDRKRTPKSELRRAESIVRIGLMNCKSHVTEAQAQHARAYRVVEFLQGKRNTIGEKI